jgi:WD40 repeat protein
VRAPRRHQVRRFAAIVLVIVGAGCATEADDPAGDGPPGDDPTTSPTVPDGPPPDDARRSFAPRFGDGSVVAAVGTTGADGVVVVTTAGWVELDPDGAAAGELVPLADDVASAALSGTGDRLAMVAGNPARLLVHDVVTQTPSLDVELSIDGAAVQQVVPASGSAFDVASTSSIERWSETGERTVLIEADPDGRLESAVSVADGAAWFAVLRDGSAATSLLRWSADGGTSTIEVPGGPSTQIGTVVASADGALVGVETFASDGASVLTVLDVGTGTVDREVRLDAASARSWLVLEDGSVVVARDGGVEFHAPGESAPGVLETGDVERLVGPPPGADSVVIVRGDGSLAVTGASPAIVSEIAGTGRSLQSVRRVDDGSVVGIDAAGVVVLWHLGDTDPVIVDRYMSDAVTDVDISSDGSLVAISRESGTVTVESVGSTTVLDHGDRKVDSVAVSPDRSFAVSGVGERLGATAFDDTVARWDLSSAGATHQVGGEGESVAGCSFFRNLIRFSPDGGTVAVNSHDFTVSLRRASDLTTVLTVQHPNNVLDFDFSPDGATLVTTAEDWVVRFWDVGDGSLIREWPAPLGGYWAIEFSPDGELLAGIGSTGQAAIVDPSTGEVVQPLEGAASWSSNVVFTPAGDRVIAGGADGDVLVWSTADGSLVDRLVGHTREVTSVVLSGDGRSLVSGSDDGTARFWSLDA